MEAAECILVRWLRHVLRYEREHDGVRDLFMENHGVSYLYTDDQAVSEETLTNSSGLLGHTLAGFITDGSSNLNAVEIELLKPESGQQPGSGG